ncbi:hypothetical protein [Streptomyces mirabilis]|uniref:hypothetical protein n=1 Tax=Streptomyces mirabilis TaxID=68239 RepID=UPI0022551FEF|nr:hypothetical protein [Streptomyces mirabilis]MCX4427017.1 hypothetical protein [Streptomyces mirabilis]MCX4428936.1 hypothetical protein [Streptomyces mirabilis]
MRGTGERARGVFAWAIPLAILAASAATVTVIVTERESGVEVSTQVRAQVHQPTPAHAKPASLTVPNSTTSSGRSTGHHKLKTPPHEPPPGNRD